MTKKFYKEDSNIKIIFNTFKLASPLSTKDKVLYGLEYYVVYKFLCPGCHTSHVGETYKHISTWTHEHLETDKKSNIYQRSRNTNQFVMRNVSQF